MEVLLILVIIAAIIIVAYLLGNGYTNLGGAAEDLAKASTAYVDSFNGIQETNLLIGHRLDNLHERTNDLEHDMQIHNLLLPLIVDALNISAAKAILEKTKSQK